MNIEADEDVNVTYDYFARPELMPPLPYPRPEQFVDTPTILGQTNERLAKLDIAPLLDPSFIKSAEQRGLGK